MIPKDYDLRRNVSNTRGRNQEGFCDYRRRSIAHSGSGIPPIQQLFEAYGKYHMLRTCNNWTNTRLKEIRIKKSLWTPIDWGVFYYLE